MKTDLGELSAFVAVARAGGFREAARATDGSASVGVQVVHSYDMLAARATEDVIVQQLVRGREHTVNVFVNGQGKCICAVPHERLEIRAGEVSKAITARHPNRSASSAIATP